MLIEPNTVIRVLSNCPLDTTYDHTIFFSSTGAQTSYFQGLTKYTLTAQSYQRVQRGKMRVQIKAEDLYDCNYLMFQNSSFGTKWFYAFIQGVEYVNNITSEITFLIDVMQTWHFDYTLGQCFVDREHASSDMAGDNTVPENFEMGDYVADDFEKSGVMDGGTIVLASTFDENFEDYKGGYFGGLFGGLCLHTFPNTLAGTSDCRNFIDNATEQGKSSGIVCIYLMKEAFAGEESEGIKFVPLHIPKSIETIGGYTPKNKKLLTYPFNFLYVTNLQGNSATYPYEYFAGSDCSFFLGGDMQPNPSVVLWPTNYKGVASNYDEKIVLSGFPMLTYNVDTFKAWTAQNGGSLAVNGLSAAFNIISGVAKTASSTSGAGVSDLSVAASTASGAGEIASGITQAANLVAQVYDHSKQPPQSAGTAGGSTLAGLNMLDFGFMHKHIRLEFATIIDDFFSMYGYATHRVKVPNRNVRPNWTYTKTVGCCLTGSIPCDDAAKICAIYDKGITFWTSGSAVGNYSLPNEV